MNVNLFAVRQSDWAEELEWSGTIGQYVDDNLLNTSEVADVANSLNDDGEFWTGGGAAQLYVLRVDSPEARA